LEYKAWSHPGGHAAGAESWAFAATQVLFFAPATIFHLALPLGQDHVSSLQLTRKRAKQHGAVMIGLVLVTHGDLAREFVKALEHVVGPQPRIECICIGPEDDMEQRRQDILAAIARVEDGAGVALLTDMFGGTPSNMAISVMTSPKIEVIAGVNLPLLVKLAKIRSERPLAEAVVEAKEAGRKYINVASQVLRGQ
jgi:PTS system mannose-specific IIA component